MGYLQSTEDQYDKAQRPYAGKTLIGKMVEMYYVGGYRRVKVVRAITTELDTLKVYELKTADGSIHYATAECLFLLG
jgi:hypothetical protein